MPMKFLRVIAPVFLVAAAFFMAAQLSYAQPSGQSSGAAAAQANAVCDTRSGHAWQVRRFVTSRVTLYGMDGARLASVARNDVANVTQVIECSNTRSFVKMDTRFGPRLAMRSALVLGGGIGPACKCAQTASTQFDSNAARSASSMGVGEGQICNADLPCVR
jgi:hypothetical protein